ncbi:MAG TPA: hypothetical protein VEG38_10225 [Acidimicrobiia bacterium]|nr:hypothetical protein [Acidimicrobiia bacterium]
MNPALALAGALVAASLIGPVPARAQAASAVCSFNFDDGIIKPGLRSTARVSADWQAGPAPIFCAGTVDGRRISGPGVIFEYGTLDGTCGQGTGMGWQIVTLPTEKGPIRIENAAPFSWTGPGGTLEGPRMHGTFQLWPTEGDCFTRPVTRYGQATQTVLRSAD